MIHVAQIFHVQLHNYEISSCDLNDSGALLCLHSAGSHYQLHYRLASGPKSLLTVPSLSSSLSHVAEVVDWQ